MTKQFITLKVGYTWSNMYGLNGEYFNTIVIKGNKVESIAHYGMYGSEERVNRVLKEKGYTEIYIPNDYGQMKNKEILPIFLSEEKAIKALQVNEDL